MGTEANHKEKASHNQKFLETIDPKEFSDWVVTVAFYKALHLVEMIFAKSKRYHVNHLQRHQALKREHPQLWMEYRPLYQQSRRARYAVRAIHDNTVSYVLQRLKTLESLINGAQVKGTL